MFNYKFFVTFTLLVCLMAACEIDGEAHQEDKEDTGDTSTENEDIEETTPDSDTADIPEDQDSADADSVELEDIKTDALVDMPVDTPFDSSDMNDLIILPPGLLSLKLSPESPARRLLTTGSEELVSLYVYETSEEAHRIVSLTVSNDLYVQYGDGMIDLVRISYTNSMGAVEQKSAFLINGEAHFSGLDILVPVGQEAGVEVFAAISNIGMGASNEDRFVLSIDPVNGFEAVGVSSGDSIFEAETSGPTTAEEMVVVENYPIFQVSAIPTNGIIIPSSNFLIAGFDVYAANDNGNLPFSSANGNYLDLCLTTITQCVTGNIDTQVTMQNGGVIISQLMIDICNQNDAPIRFDFNQADLIVSPGQVRSLEIHADTSKLDSLGDRLWMSSCGGSSSINWGANVESYGELVFTVFLQGAIFVNN